MSKKDELVVVTEDLEVIYLDISEMSKDDALTELVRGNGLSNKEANKYWAENKPARGTGFAARYYDRLAVGPMSDEDFADYIADESDNIRVNNKKHYDAIRVFANKIWANVETYDAG